MTPSSNMNHLVKKFASSRLTITIHNGDKFLIVDPSCDRAYPFIYDSYIAAHDVLTYISNHNESLWPCHPTGWIAPQHVTLRAMR
jgi:hypothetical protein